MEEDVILSLKRFFGKYPIFKYKKGETIIRFDDEDPYFVYFLVKGFIRQYSITHRGEEISVNIFKPYSFLPMGLYLCEKKNYFTFVAMTDVKVRRASKHDVLAFLKSNPQV